MINVSEKESQKRFGLTEWEYEEDFRGYMPQFLLKVGSVKRRARVFKIF